MKKMILTTILLIVLSCTAAFATTTSAIHKYMISNVETRMISSVETHMISNVDSTVYNYAKDAKFYNDPSIYLDIKIGDDKVNFMVYEKCIIGDTIYLIGKSDMNGIKAISINKDGFNLITNGKRSVQVKNAYISALLINEIDQINNITHI